MATNPYSYGSLGQRWTVGEPTSKSLLDVSRVKADANRWALEQLVVDPDDTANFVLTAPGLNIDSNTLYVDSVNNSVGFGLTNPNDYAFNGTPSWVASGGAGNASVIVVSGTTSIGYLSFADGTTGTDRYSGNIQYNHSTNTMSFRTNGGVEAMVVDSSQRVGIGTTSPQLRVSTEVPLGGSDGFGVQYSNETKGELTVNPSTGEVRMGATNSTGTYFTTLYSNGSERARIDLSGNVGIGTSSPIVPLHLVTTSGSAASFFDAQGSANASYGQYINDLDSYLQVGHWGSVRTDTFGGINVSNYAIVRAAGPTNGLIVGTLTSDPLVFATADSERARIDSSGNVGIGTSSPSLQAWRTNTYLTISNGTDGGVVELVTSASDASLNEAGAILWGATGNTTNHKHLGGIEMVTDGSTATQRGAYMRLLTKANGTAQPAERARIHSGGQVSINSTATNGTLNVAAGNSTVDGTTTNAGRDVAYVMINSTAGAAALRAEHNGGNPYDGDMVVFNQFYDGSNYTWKERLRVLSSGGITFNGDTAAANALDDYEEGTHTVTLGLSTSGSITLNSTYQYARYQKVGRWVTVSGRLRVSSVSSPSGVVNLYLPFTSHNFSGDSGMSTGACYVANSGINANSYGLVLFEGVNYASIYNMDLTSGYGATGSQFSGDETIVFSITYEVA